MENIYLLLFAIVPFLLPRVAKRGSVIVIVALLTMVYGLPALGELCGFTFLDTYLHFVSFTPLSAIFALLCSCLVLPVMLVYREDSTKSSPQQSLFYGAVVALFISVMGVLISATPVVGSGFGGDLVGSGFDFFLPSSVYEPAFGSIFDFAFNWELMGLSSFALFILGSDRRDYLHSAVLYFISMHVGFIFILAGFLTVQSGSGALFGDGSMGLGSWLLFFVGFGLKSAVFPFHFWLPHSYRAASGVGAALMAALSTNMGIFGIILITFSAFNIEAVSLILMALGLMGALYGSLMMVKVNSLSSVLSYSSIENIGVIVFAIGLSFYAKNEGVSSVAFLASVVAVIKFFNHAISKSMLFSVTGVVRGVVGSDRISDLGGLWRSMPMSSVVFGVGGLSLSSVPVMGSFVSEFLLFMVLFLALSFSSLSIIAIVAIIVVALVSAVAVFSFSKSLGVGFLGHPRTKSALGAKEPGGMSITVGYSLFVLFACLGSWAVAYLFIDVAPAAFALNAEYSTWVWGILWGIVRLCALLVATVGLLWFVRFMLTRRRLNRVVPTWSCAYDSPINAKAQYSAESFSLEATLVASYPAHSSSKSSRALRNRISPMLFMRRWTARLALFQTGRTSHYIMHIIWFLALVLILTLTSVL